MADRDTQQGKRPTLTRRQALIGAGIAAGAIAAGPVSLALPEAALAALPSVTVASQGRLHYPYADWSDHQASHASWFQSSRGTAMYCIARSYHTFADNWASGTSMSFWDSNAFGLFSRDDHIARAVAWLVANHYGAGAASYEATECQIAIWMVLEYATSPISWDDAFVNVWGNTNTHMQPVSVDWATSAWSFGKSGDSSYDRRVCAWRPASGAQPLAFWDPIVTTDLWLGVTPAAANGHALADGVYRIRSAYNESYCLDANSDSAMGVQLKVWEETDTWNQLFHLKCVDSWNLFEVRPLNSLALTYDVENAGGSGSRVMKWYQNSAATANQRYYLEHSDNGSWCIAPSHSAETALDLETYSIANGTKVITWSRTRQENGYGTTSPSQRWYLERWDVNRLAQATSTADTYQRGMSGGVYAIYDHQNLDVELGRFNLRDDGWGRYEGVWNQVDEQYYVHMVKAPAGYRFDNQTYRFNIQEQLISSGGRPWMVTSIEPEVWCVRHYVVDLDGTTHLVGEATLVAATQLTLDSACFAAAEAKAKADFPDDYPYLRKWYLDVATSVAFSPGPLSADLTLFARRPGSVHFMWLDHDGTTWHEVHSARVTWGETLSASGPELADADSALRSALDVEVMDHVDRWYTDKDMGARLSSLTVKSDVYLYARPSWGYVTHYVDGTGPANVVTMPDGSRARFGPFAWGHRYEVSAEVTEAARAAGCTPGLASWYSDSADPWVASDAEPATPATTGSRTESLVIAAAETGLYATNRLTLSFALADGSVDPAGEELLASMADGAATADTTLPDARVVRRLRTYALRGYELAYRRGEDGRWRTLRPRAWYDDAAAAGTASLSVRPSADCARYALWRWNTADGVVDERG